MRQVTAMDDTSANRTVIFVMLLSLMGVFGVLVWGVLNTPRRECLRWETEFHPEYGWRVDANGIMVQDLTGPLVWQPVCVEWAAEPSEPTEGAD